MLDAVRFDWIDSPAEGARRRALAWTLARSGAYDAAQQYETAHRMRQEAGRQHPDNLIVQLRVEGDYWSFGERTQASLLLERLLEEREPWLESERDAIYVRLTDRLWQLRRLDRLAATCERWIRTQPRTQNAWQRYVSSLYFQGKTEEADQTLLRWMSAPLDAEPNPATEAARAAAVAIVLGSGWNFHVNRLDRMWHAPLADLARRSARSDRHGDTYAARILGHWRFNRTDAARELRKELRADVLAPGALETLPLDRLSRLITLLSWRRNEIDEPTWRRMTLTVAPSTTGTRTSAFTTRLICWPLVLCMVDNGGVGLEVVRSFTICLTLLRTLLLS